MVDGAGAGTAVMFSVTGMVVGADRTDGALMVREPVSDAPAAVPAGILAGFTEMLTVWEPDVPVDPLVGVAVSQAPLLVVPTVKFTEPPVLVRVRFCAAGADPAS